MFILSKIPQVFAGLSCQMFFDKGELIQFFLSLECSVFNLELRHEKGMIRRPFVESYVRVNRYTP